MSDTAVIIPCYKRTRYLPVLIDSLLAQRKPRHHILIVSDGAKGAQDQSMVDHVRNALARYIRQEGLSVIFRDDNFGLKRNIEQSVDEACENYPRFIVVEDDIAVSAGFLAYMDHYLDLYEAVDDVCCVAGYSYLKPDFLGNSAHHYLVRGGDCLAWGSWSKVWQRIYEPNSEIVLKKVQERISKQVLNRNGSYNYMKMLTDNVHDLKSWAINWYAVSCATNMFTVYPTRSLALHQLNEEAATNYKLYSAMNDPLTVPIFENVELDSVQMPLREDEMVTEMFNSYLRRANGNMLQRIRYKFRRIIHG